MAVRVPINFYANVDDAASEFKKLTTVFKALGAAFVANKIVDGLGSIIGAAAEAAEASNSMRSALKIAGDFSERNAAQFEKLAEQIQQNTKFDDDLVLSQVAVAKQFGATNKQTEKLIKAAVQLSAATGQDLSGSMNLLAKSLDGSAGKLNELVPGMRQLTAEQLAAGEAADLVLKLYSGAAEAQVNTFTGAIEQSKNVFGGLAEALGDIVVSNPATIEAIRGVTEVFQVLKESVIENKEGLQEFVRGGIQLAAEGFGIFVQMLAAVDKGISRVTQGYKILKGDFEGFEKAVDAEEARAEVYDKITEKAAGLSVQLEKMSGTQKAISEGAKTTADGFDSQITKIRSVNAELATQYKQLEESVKNIGSKQSETISNNYVQQVQLVKRALDQKIVGETQAATTLRNLSMKFDQEIAEARKKEREERLAKEQEFLNRLRDISSNPLKIVFEQDQLNTSGISDKLREGLSAGIGSISTVLGGKEGARNLIGSFAESAGQAFFGVPGLGELAKVLSQGPDKVRELVREFAKALPELIKAIILAIPVVIEELAKAVPDIVSALVDALPEIIDALIEALPKVIEALAKVGPKIAEKLISAAGGFIGKILEGAGQFIGKIVESIGKEIARIFEDLNPFKEGFNPTGGGGFGLGGDKGLLGGGLIPGLLKGGGGGLRIPVAPSAEQSTGTGPVNAQIVVQIERRELAKAMVDLNRLGYRLA